MVLTSLRRNVEVGDVYTVGLICSKFKLMPDEAEAMLSEIEQKGYLKYQEPGVNPKFGSPTGNNWKLTFAGLEFVERNK